MNSNLIINRLINDLMIFDMQSDNELIQRINVNIIVDIFKYFDRKPPTRDEISRQLNFFRPDEMKV